MSQVLGLERLINDIRSYFTQEIHPIPDLKDLSYEEVVDLLHHLVREGYGVNFPTAYLAAVKRSRETPV